ncbi:MAG: PKD domain-containing protein, partial [Methanoculleus sp.]
GEWQEIAATVDPATRTVTAQVDHFSIYALAWTVPETVAAGAEGTATQADSPTGEPGTALPTWALALIIVLVVALAASLLMRRK